MSLDPLTLSDAAISVLETAPAEDKAIRSRQMAKAWRERKMAEIGTGTPPVRPARPAHPELLPPRDMPRRKAQGEKGRIALIHAIAHIELNAIDLAWDIIARFTADGLPRDFYDDWVRVADDEARHFQMLNGRLADLGGAYGDLPAHDGLWEAAEETKDDLLPRLAIVPMVLEARGLDATPGTSARLRKAGDDKSAEIMDQIGAEEVRHVAIGVKWFEHLCDSREMDPIETFRRLVSERFKGRLKPPFADEARALAGMSPAYYMPID
ncbi:MAG: ferritin-like domain-containing protein [Proteobacteria bacterium]|nr:ferritin-like domain-containing protein [Pseudomonadota bacterium]